MTRTFMRWPNFRRKALTLSYDDGIVYDRRLIEIMDKNGLKGTFNLNSGFFAEREGGLRLTKNEAFSLYANSGHEVAAHGVKHLSLSMVDESMAMNDVINDRVNLEEMFGRLVQGFAYANGSYDDKTVEILKRAGIHYARTVGSTEKFDVPTDWLRMPATCHHANPRLMGLAKRFVESGDGYNFWWTHPQLFYLWGHSYEFNDSNNWEVIEEFAEYIGNREDIWYATNGEIYNYVKAFDSLEFSANGAMVYNPSAIDVYICYFTKNYLIPSGKIVKIDPSY